MVKYKHFRTCLNLFWLDEVLFNLESSIWSYCKKCCNKRTLEYVWTCFDLLKRWKIWFNFKISLWHSCKSWCKLNTLEHVGTCLDFYLSLSWLFWYTPLVEVNQAIVAIILDIILLSSWVPFFSFFSNLSLVILVASIKKTWLHVYCTAAMFCTTLKYEKLF